MDYICYKKIALSIVLLSVFFSSSVFCAPSSPKRFVQRLELLTKQLIADQKLKEANTIFAEHMDMSEFSKRSLIDYIYKFSEEEFKDFVILFEKNIRKKMNSKLMFTSKDTNFRIEQKGVSFNKSNNIIISTNILHTEKGNFSLKIFLKKISDEYRIIDYEFEGALLSRNYRGSFNYIIKNYSKDGLFNRLRNKLE